MSYLIEGIKKHQIFNSDIKFWEACILYKNFNVKMAKGTEKSLSTFQSKVCNNILQVVANMKDIGLSKQLVKDMSQKYITAYKLPETLTTNITSLVSTLTK
jgi:hypothetical protein